MVAFAVAPVLTREDVAAVAALANLELDASELDRFAKQLGDILAYAAEVQQIDTTGVAPTASIIARRPADRADVVIPSLSRDLALANAPDASAAAGMFKVPRVLR
jgi:aspartyl-tRNA(Asn)/glutamyl-tRNA(Gln) amidotransferase subunit C